MVTAVTSGSALAAIVLALAGCGGGGGGDVGQAVVDMSGYEAALCEKVGIMVFVGEREDVYGCDLFESAEDLETYGESYANARGCFVVVDGSATDVSEAMAADPDLSFECS